MDNFQKIGRVLLKILVLNWIVALLKIFLGLTTGALSILADGVHALLDGVSNILGIIGIKIARKPADAKYPYGYYKYEAIASLGILVLLLFAAYKFSIAIYQRIIEPFYPEITILVFVVLGATLVIDYLVAKYEYSKGKELKSVILKADSHHTKSHLLITLAVILGIFVVRIGYPVFDLIVSGIIVAWILKIAIVDVFLKEILGILSDKAIIKPKEIQKIIKDIEGIIFCHQIRTHGSESHIFLDMHIVMNPGLSLEEAHGICYYAKKKIQEKFPETIDISIHPEPLNKNKKCSCE